MCFCQRVLVRLFAIVVVQIKPQLEKLLNLPNDSLTKDLRGFGYGSVT